GRGHRGGGGGRGVPAVAAVEGADRGRGVRGQDVVVDRQRGRVGGRVDLGRPQGGSPVQEGNIPGRAGADGGGQGDRGAVLGRGRGGAEGQPAGGGPGGHRDNRHPAELDGRDRRPAAAEHRAEGRPAPARPRAVGQGHHAGREARVPRGDDVDRGPVAEQLGGGGVDHLAGQAADVGEVVRHQGRGAPGRAAEVIPVQPRGGPGAGGVVHVVQPVAAAQRAAAVHVQDGELVRRGRPDRRAEQLG